MMPLLLSCELKENFSLALEYTTLTIKINSQIKGYRRNNGIKIHGSTCQKSN